MTDERHLKYYQKTNAKRHNGSFHELINILQQFKIFF